MIKIGRKPKYEFGTENVTLSINSILVDLLRKHAKKIGIPLSSLASKVLERALMKDQDFHLIMAKHHASLMHYHKTESERLKNSVLEESEEVNLPWT